MTCSFRISFCAPPPSVSCSQVSAPSACSVHAWSPKAPVSQPGDPRCHSEQGTPMARGALNQGQCCCHSDLTHLPCPVLGVSSELLTSWAHEDELRGAGQAGFTPSSCSREVLTSHTADASRKGTAQLGLLSPNSADPEGT